MTDEELKIVAENLIAENQADAIFGIYQYGGSSDESFIKANKSGLQIYAAELLQASLNCENIIADKEKTIIPFDQDAEWIDENGDTFLHYIQPIAGTRLKPAPEAPYKFSKLKEDLAKIGCFIVAVFLVICVLLGIGKIGTAIFS